MSHRWLRFAALFVPALSADLVSKSWALRTLEPGQTIQPLGPFLPLTLSFNRGAAFSLRFGDHSRLLFVLFSIVALIGLLVYYGRTPAAARLRAIVLPLIAAGALGNLIDRVRWETGVVDFLGPYDLGFMQWPIFNVADICISCGAVLLSIALWREERRATIAASNESG
jgi:signal peptidase II